MSGKDWITSLVGPLVSGLIVAAASLGGTIYVLGSHDRGEKETQVFRNEAQSFEALTANYVRHMLDDQKPDSEATDLLIKNLFAQQSSIDAAIKHLPERDSRLALEYRNNTSDLIRLIPQIKTVDAMRPFWEQVSKLLVLRNEVLSKLPT